MRMNYRPPCSHQHYDQLFKEQKSSNYQSTNEAQITKSNFETEEGVVPVAATSSSICSQCSQPCTCWRGGIYCCTSVAGPTPLLWWFGHPDAAQFFSRNSRQWEENSTLIESSITGAKVVPPTGPTPPTPPVHLKHFYVVQELRRAIRELWTTSSLSEMIPENSKVNIVCFVLCKAVCPF